MGASRSEVVNVPFIASQTLGFISFSYFGADILKKVFMT